MKKLLAVFAILILTTTAFGQKVYYPNKGHYVGSMEVIETINSITNTLHTNNVNTINGKIHHVEIIGGNNVTVGNVATNESQIEISAEGPGDFGITKVNGQTAVASIDFYNGTNNVPLKNEGNKLIWGQDELLHAGNMAGNVVTKINDKTGLVVITNGNSGVKVATTTANNTNKVAISVPGVTGNGTNVTNIAFPNNKAIYETGENNDLSINGNVIVTADNIDELGVQSINNFKGDVSVTNDDSTITVSTVTEDSKKKIKIKTNPRSLGITLGTSANSTNISKLNLGTNELSFTDSNLQWNSENVAMQSDVSSVVTNITIAEHEPMLKKSNTDTTAAYTLDLSHKEQYFYKSANSPAEVILTVPNATEENIGELTLYIEENYASNPVIFKFVAQNNNIIELPSEKPWESSTTSQKSLWKFVFVTIPGSTSWYFDKAVEYVLTPVTQTSP